MRPRLLGQVRGAGREGAQSRRSRGISRLHPHLGQIREVDEEGEVAARLLRKVAEIEEVVMRLVLLARVVPHHLQRLEHRVVVAREVGDARADGVDRPVAACERRRRRRPPVLEAEYANLRARIRYCAAYSEHGVNTTEKTTYSASGPPVLGDRADRRAVEVRLGQPQDLCRLRGRHTPSPPHLDRTRAPCSSHSSEWARMSTIIAE